METFEILASGGTVISVRERVAKTEPADPKRKNDTGGTEMVYWGDDNLYPQYLNQWIETHPILSSKLPAYAAMISSGGVVYCKETKDGYEVIEDQEVADWLEEINISLYLNDMPVEMVKFNNGFAELILSRDKSRIANIVCQESTFCRVSRNDRKDVKPTCFMSANWDLGDQESSETTIKRPLLDLYNNPVDKLKEEKGFAAVVHVKGSSSGRVHYPEPQWTAGLKSKWVEYSLAIPEAKLAKINNAMMVMYHIEVPAEYWKGEYPDWDEMPELKKDRKKEKQAEWTRALTDKKNWGKVLMTGYQQLLNEKNTTHHILFKVLENPFKNSELIEDSFEANSQIYQAMGFDATLFGTIPGKQMGAGSGSDKEWAWILAILSSKSLQDMILSPIQFGLKFNGKKGKLVMRNYLLAQQYMLKARGDKKDPNPGNSAK